VETIIDRIYTMMSEAAPAQYPPLVWIGAQDWLPALRL
jgi:hypothetical protein